LTVETVGIAVQSLQDLVWSYVRERRDSGDFLPATAVNVRCDLLSFATHAGVGPARVTSQHVERWVSSGNPARSTRRRRFSYVKLFCQWLVRKGHLAADPTLGLKAPRVPKPVPRGLALEDIRRLILAAPDPRARFILVWMAQLGLRCVELTRLELSDIDHEDRVVRIVGKGGWHRIMPVTLEASHALTGYLLVRGLRPGPLLEMSANHLSRLVSRWMAAAGVPGTAHALRHSMATHLLRVDGADIKDVQAALGHQSLTSTAVYLPFSDVERLRTVMEGRWYGPLVETPHAPPVAG
jgi:integrase/recombinase XerC